MAESSRGRDAGPPSSAARKLGIRCESTLVLVGATSDWQVPDLPEGAILEQYADAHSARELVLGTREHVVLAFFRHATEVEPSVQTLAPRIFPDGALWVAWPRRAGGHTSDITDETVRRAAIAYGLVDNKVAAIDDDWSGLRVVWRSASRREGLGAAR